MSHALDSPKTTLAGQMEDVEQRNRILNMIRGGGRAAQVAEALGISEDKVKSTVKKYLNRMHTEDAATLDELRVLENERLDAMERRLRQRLQAIEENRLDGDPLKIEDRLLRLYERRAKLNGLDAPLRVEHSGGLEVLHDLALDKEFIEGSTEAFRTAFYREDGTRLPDPVIDGTAVDVDEALKALEK